MSGPTPSFVIALVGAGGKLGTYISHGIKNSPYDFEIRTLSRKAEPPKGSDAQNHSQVDFHNVEQLKESLKGCHFLINCMGTSGSYHISKMNLIHAAAAAGVYGYITSDFGVDYNVPNDHFDHPVWHEKQQHVEYSKSQGLRTLAICVGLFQEGPFGAFGPWHGFDVDSRTFIVAGTGHEPISVTSKIDIGAAVARICHIVLTTEATQEPSEFQPLAGKDYVRISGQALTPHDVIGIIHRHGEAEDRKDEDRSRDWKVQALISDEQRAAFQASMKLVAMDEAAEAAIGADADFDPQFANDIAGRVFRAMGDGTLHLAENDNELLNPGEKYWKWTSLTNFERDTKPKTLWE